MNLKTITKENYLSLVKQGYNVIPIVVELNREFPITFLYEQFRDTQLGSGLLESGRAGQYSYVPFHAIGQIEAKRGMVKLTQMGKERLIQEDPLTSLETLCSQWKAPGGMEGPDWLGGAIGYFSYDFVRSIEHLPDVAKDDLQIPDYRWVFFRDLIAVDHFNSMTYVITNVMADEGDGYEEGLNRIQQWLQHLNQCSFQTDSVSNHSLGMQESKKLKINPSFTQDGFEKAVGEIQDYIRAGDVFQVNLSVRQDFPIQSSAWDIYKTLRVINPSPYKAFLEYPDFQVACGSPELLIKIKERKISTRPIAGTRPRGKNAEEDLRLAQELIENPKERAEHIMLVDLERNDLGRVCTYGSVQVSDLMVIEKYSHVMHIVSHVEGELADHQTSFDAVRACFPGGTITGAPKIRTMEIIEELEPVKRGIYTGSIGWLGFNGDMELNIVIRTLLAKNQYGYVQAGAGIVIDSNPEAEYYESLKKAEALLRAVEQSEAFYQK